MLFTNYLKLYFQLKRFMEKKNIYKYQISGFNKIYLIKIFKKNKKYIYI